jgi:peptidoglycan/LPS O-acetylase OafA/YrhL
LLILFVGKLLRGKYFSGLFGTLALISLVYCIYLTAADPTLAYYSPLSRAWELVLQSRLFWPSSAFMPGSGVRVC